MVLAHDERDFEFATQFELSVILVVNPPSDHPKREDILAGRSVSPHKAWRSAVSSGRLLRAMPHGTARNNGTGAAINYKLRDWLFSRRDFGVSRFQFFTGERRG